MKKAPKEGEEKRPAKPKKVQIIQPPKDQNMNIMLAQFGKIKFSELAESIRNIDENGINGLAGVNNLLDNLPSGEETSAVLSYVEGGGDPGLLGKAELFTFAISKVDGVVHRLEAMRTRCMSRPRRRLSGRRRTQA